MKMTLLEIVQDILNDLDSDEVNSISDTIESEQVAQIVKTCYYEMIGNRNWPHLKKLFQMEHAGSLTKPNYLRIPEDIKELEFIRYEYATVSGKVEFKDLKFEYPDVFLRKTSSRDSSSDNISTVIDYSGSKLLIVNDKPPSFWTTFDDTYIVTDAYDKNEDDTLKKSKTQCMGYFTPAWVHADTAVPNLPVEAFPALLAEAKSTAFIAVKQMTNQKAEQKANRQQKWLSRKAWQLEGGVRYPDYGRKGKK